MALVSQAQDALSPPSPALTNPDMILPYNPSYKDPIHAPSRKPISQQSSESFTKFGSISEQSLRSSMHQLEQTAQQTSDNAVRPSMPGEWQTETDINKLQPPTAHEAGGMKRRSGAKLISTILDPRLRAGLAVENCEYSPSIYSPTESELASRSPYPKSPYPRSPYQASEGSNLKSPYPNNRASKLRSPYRPVDGPFDDKEEPSEDVDHPQDQVRAILDEDENDPFSHTALSVRAEEILANAKQRLTVPLPHLNTPCE